MKSRISVMACSAAAFVLLLGSIAPAAAQSLADVARREEERRKDVKEPAKVYTNKDLRGGGSALPAPAGDEKSGATTPAAGEKAGEKAAASGDKPAGAAAADAQKDKDKDKNVKDQAYWQKRAADLRLQLSRDQGYADAMQVKVDALTRDFSARDDPAQRSKIGSDRQASLTELDRLKTAIKNDQKAIADLEDEARRASVPPGWLR